MSTWMIAIRIDCAFLLHMKSGILSYTQRHITTLAYAQLPIMLIQSRSSPKKPTALLNGKLINSLGISLSRGMNSQFPWQRRGKLQNAKA